ncbi:MAG TPA: transposase [Kiritimatiellia bacterium]|nr:transposase [Kiritimatiellia bacterium]
MARKPRLLYPGAIYHVTFRALHGQELFTTPGDRRRLLERLAIARDAYEVRIYLYCLMPNHVHLLVETPKANLDRFMGSLLTSYTVYFNRRHDRYGHVVQGRYGAQLVSGDDYLLKLSRYIHLNPIRTEYWEGKSVAEKLDFLHQFGWSSYRAYAGFAPEPEWLETAPTLELTRSATGSDARKAYRDFVESGVSDGGTEFKSAVHGNSLAIGPERFCEEIRAKYVALSGNTVREDVSFRKTRSKAAPESVRDHVQRLLGDDAFLLDKPVHGAPHRALLCRALQRYSGLTQREIARFIGVATGAAVCTLMAKYRENKEVTSALATLDSVFKG